MHGKSWCDFLNEILRLLVFAYLRLDVVLSRAKYSSVFFFFGFCLFFLSVGCKTSSLIYFTLAYSSSQSMQMIGDCRTVSLGKCGKTTQWHQVWVSGAVHWFTPIINEADGTYSHSHPPTTINTGKKIFADFSAVCVLCAIFGFYILDFPRREYSRDRDEREQQSRLK